MTVTQRGRQLVHLAGVLPRSAAALRGSPGWNPRSARGLRQLGEVALDEFALTGFTLFSPPPVLGRPLSDCVPAAEQLTGLGIDRAHADPDPLRVQAIRRRRLGRLRYETLSFEHDPRLPSSLVDLGGPATAEVRLLRGGGGPRPWLVWVHGAGQGGVSDLRVARAQQLHRELGFNIALPVQPGHGARRTAWPAYPGHDPLANTAGTMRVVSEVRALVRWLRPQASVIVVAGLSLGSPVAALVSHLEPAVDAVAVYTPIGGLNAMIGRHLWQWGDAGREVAHAMQSEVAAALTSVVDPLITDPIPPPQCRLIVAARHDRMAYAEPAETLHQRWGGAIHWHDGSHVGHLFSRQVRVETQRFLAAVSEGTSR